MVTISRYTLARITFIGEQKRGINRARSCGLVLPARFPVSPVSLFAGNCVCSATRVKSLAFRFARCALRYLCRDVKYVTLARILTRYVHVSGNHYGIKRGSIPGDLAAIFAGVIGLHILQDHPMRVALISLKCN